MASIKSTAIVITLLTLCVLAANASAAYRGCCRSYMKTKIPCAAIKGYSIQTSRENCPIDAIVFHTKKGDACTNPALSWVMDCVNRVRNKAQKVHNHSHSVPTRG